MKVLFAGGGTGGHVFPAVAIAQALETLEERHECVFVGTARKIESRVFPELGYRFHPIWISGIRRTWAPENILFPLKVCVSMIQSFMILQREKPDVVVGTGGYVSGPILLVSALLRYPTLIQEQNSFPGVTTRLLARFVDEVHIAFEQSRSFLRGAKDIRVSGNPVRFSGEVVSPAESRTIFTLDPATPTLLVLGGSLGASAINHAITAALPALMEARMQLIWQTGECDFQAAAEVSVEWRDRIAVRAFIPEMHQAYSAADLVVCRAGATTVAEIAALGKACIFIPFPHATADHQYHNARILAESEAAVLLPESEIHRLEETVAALMRDEGRRKTMAREARAFGKPDAARIIAASIRARAQGATQREGKTN